MRRSVVRRRVDKLSVVLFVRVDLQVPCVRVVEQTHEGQFATSFQRVVQAVVLRTEGEDDAVLGELERLDSVRFPVLPRHGRGGGAEGVVDEVVQRPDQVLTRPGVARLQLVAREHPRDGLTFHLGEPGVLRGGGLDDDLATEGKSLSLELLPVRLAPRRNSLCRRLGVLHDAVVLGSVWPKARRQASLRKDGTNARDAVLVESFNNRIVLRHARLAGLRHYLEVLQGVDDLASVVAVEPVDRAIADEVPQGSRRVVGVVRRHRVDVSKSRPQVLDGKCSLVSRDAKHVAVRRSKMVRRQVLTPLVEHPPEGSCELLHVPHLPACARLAVRVLGLVREQMVS